MLLAESAYWSTWGTVGLASNHYSRAPLDPSNWIGPSVHYRHNAVAIAAYCDGHAKAASQKMNVSANDPSLADLSIDDSAYDLQ